CGVVSLLLLSNHRFHRQVCQHRAPLAEYQGLPEPPHPPITVSKWMNEFELIMEDATGYQRMPVGNRQPLQQIVHQVSYTARRRRHMDKLLAAIDADTCLSKPTDIVDQSKHEQFVSLE